MAPRSRVRRVLGILLCGGVLAASPAVVGCGAVAATESTGPAWPPIAKKWFDRAQASYRSGDVEDAQIAIDNALRVAPDRDEVKLLAARIALCTLEYDRVLQLLKGVAGADAGGLRGRALWYAGSVEKAADELEALIANPDVRDPWATEVSKLARRGGGRKPFTLGGGLLGVVDMPQVASTWMVVPVEVNGEPALAALATATAETLIDSSGGAEASWISLRFGERVEVRDVPALPKDLSGISKQLNAPIKLLIGVNLLRHLHPTIDFLGGQFVVRSFDPPPPPAATTVRLVYVRGGGMLMRGAFSADENAPYASMMIDTSMSFPVALGESGWKKAGIKLSSLRAIEGGGGPAPLKQGVLPLLRVGAFEIPEVPALYGVPVKQMSDELKVDLDGVVGSGLLAPFRVTLVDGGRSMWLEDLPSEALERRSAPLESVPDEPVEEAPADSAAPALAPPKGASAPSAAPASSH